MIKKGSRAKGAFRLFEVLYIKSAGQFLNQSVAPFSGIGIESFEITHVSMMKIIDLRPRLHVCLLLRANV